MEQGEREVKEKGVGVAGDKVEIHKAPLGDGIVGGTECPDWAVAAACDVGWMGLQLARMSALKCTVTRSG